MGRLRVTESCIRGRVTFMSYFFQVSLDQSFLFADSKSIVGISQDPHMYAHILVKIDSTKKACR